MTSVLEWEEPPLKRGSAYDWGQIAQALESKPMKWAKVFDRGPTSTANAIRQDSVTALLSTHGFEVRTANNTREPHRTCTLYLRYNPEHDERRG
jgi:hypothetical protein